MDSINTMNLLVFLFTFIIIVGALTGGFLFLVLLRKEGEGSIKRGIEIFCKGQIKRLKTEKSAIDKINYFYPAGTIAINNLKISIYELFIKN